MLPQGLKSAPATFNRMVSQVLRPLRDFSPSYFDDIFVHTRAKGNTSAIQAHLKHLKQNFKSFKTKNVCKVEEVRILSTGDSGAGLLCEQMGSSSRSTNDVVDLFLANIREINGVATMARPT